MSTETSPSRTLSQKLDHLFREMPPHGQGEYTYREVAAGIRELGGPTRMSATYLWLLRTGLRDNPSRKVIEGISAFFGVPVSYFFDDAVTAQIDTQLDLVRALRNTSVRELALRAADLSTQGLAAVAVMVEHVRRLEGLTEALET